MKPAELADGRKQDATRLHHRPESFSSSPITLNREQHRPWTVASQSLTFMTNTERLHQPEIVADQVAPEAGDTPSPQLR